MNAFADHSQLSMTMRNASSLFLARMHAESASLNLCLVVRNKNLDTEILERSAPGVRYVRSAESRSPFGKHVEIYCDQSSLPAYQRWESLAESAGESLTGHLVSSLQTRSVLLNHACRWLIACHHAIDCDLAKWPTKIFSREGDSIVTGPPGRLFHRLDPDYENVYWHVKDVHGMSVLVAEALASVPQSFPTKKVHTPATGDKSRSRGGQTTIERDTSNQRTDIIPVEFQTESAPLKTHAATHFKGVSWGPRYKAQQLKKLIDDGKLKAIRVGERTLIMDTRELGVKDTKDTKE